MAKRKSTGKKNTAAKKTATPKKKSAGFNLPPFVLILGMLALLFSIYIGYRISTSDRKIVTISLLALFAGLLLESMRLIGNWKIVLFTLLGAYILSLLGFLPGRGGRSYDFETHIQIWPYWIIFIFSILVGVFNKDKVTAKLTEGTTLLQSLSVLYWIADYGFMNINHWFPQSLLIIALLFCFFSLVQALTYTKLSRPIRLTLSIWSSVIMLAFAIDNIYRVYQNEDIESTRYLSDGLFIGLQFFLLGISALYIVQNFMLLVGFLPSKNGNYRKDLKEIRNDHINRYCGEQVAIGHSILCILFAIIVYGLNYEFKILPRHTLIWLVFLIFPFIVQFTSKERPGKPVEQ